jgi:YkoY family integral membrane protein
MDVTLAFLHHYLGADLRVAAFIILNLIVIESLLSVDNAAVLARLVMDLPPAQRKLALRIGILLAYIFRGACLVFAGILMRISWLKLLGGAYLLYLFFNFFYKKVKATMGEEEKAIAGPTFIFINPFFTTVLMVELMDLTFSIDNVFAAVAFTHNIYLVCIGVFIGIIAMRVVAGYFVGLMQRFPFLDTIALVVIGLLGVKLCLSFFAPYIGGSLEQLIDRPKADFYFSVLTVCVFAVPLLSSLIVGYPKQR